jgi:hypothetical protein
VGQKVVLWFGEGHKFGCCCLLYIVLGLLAINLLFLITLNDDNLVCLLLLFNK